jgi:peroxiredoxin
LRRSLVLLCAALVAFAAQAGELKPWTGGPAPGLALPDLAGREHRLEEYRGKVVLINFWATWCEPCSAEMPSMSRLRAALAGRPFEVLAVNLAEPESRIRRFLEQTPLPFPILRDADSAVSKAWRARVLPVSFIVGPDGRIRYHVVGEYDWDQPAARKAIAALLPREATQPRAALSAASP